MKRNRKLLKSKNLACDLGALAVMLLANKLADAIEKRKYAVDTEEVLKRKLTIISLIYHAIGIVYNE